MAFDKYDYRYIPDRRSFFLKKADGIDVFYTDDVNGCYFVLYSDFYRLNESKPYRQIKTFFREFDDMKDFIDQLRNFYSYSSRGFTLHHVVL